MPANLVEGDLARDVAAYVAYAAARGGRGPRPPRRHRRRRGRGRRQGRRTACIDIPADPDGQLVYEFASAEAQPGPLEINSPNESNVDHNIALEGGGLDEIGPVVAGRRRLRPSRSTSRPASTPSTARSPATARAAWKARSPSSEVRRPGPLD